MFTNSVNQFQGEERSIILFQEKRFRMNISSMSCFCEWNLRTITMGACEYLRKEREIENSHVLWIDDFVS